MKKYEITGGIATVDGGDVLELSEAQYKPRAHNVDVMKKTGANGGVVCRAKTPLQFIVGEVVWLAVPPIPVHAARFKEIPDPAVAELEAKAARKGKATG